jgi:sulfatase modifying factor 1
MTKMLLRDLRLLGCMLVLLSAQGCHREASTPDSSQASGRVDSQAGKSAPVATSSGQPTQAERDGMVLIKGGAFLMGTDDAMPYEAPAHETVVNAFWIDEHEVTVAEFASFVKATGYRTDAEQFGWSGVFNLKTGEWERVDGANWQHPDGPETVAAPNEPVCQVSWSDAAAYALWAGKRLPTEAEWEYAARGGLVGKRYAWGDDLRPLGQVVANWWQGQFPEHNTGEDGFIGRAPVRSFQPNGYGVYDVAGNVWEWCADWYADDYYQGARRDNPAGPTAGTERVIRGGSWMCAENFCTNYRVAARSHATPDTGLNNLGFRCVRDP